MYNFEEKPISTLTSTPSLSFDDPKSILTYVLSPMGSNLGVLTSTMKSPWLLWQLLFDQQIAANNKKKHQIWHSDRLFGIGQNGKIFFANTANKIKRLPISYDLLINCFNESRVFFTKVAACFELLKTDLFLRIKICIQKCQTKEHPR